MKLQCSNISIWKPKWNKLNKENSWIYLSDFINAKNLKKISLIQLKEMFIVSWVVILVTIHYTRLIVLATFLVEFNLRVSVLTRDCDMSCAQVSCCEIVICHYFKHMCVVRQMYRAIPFVRMSWKIVPQIRWGDTWILSLNTVEFSPPDRISVLDIVTENIQWSIADAVIIL